MGKAESVSARLSERGRPWVAGEDLSGCPGGPLGRTPFEPESSMAAFDRGVTRRPWNEPTETLE